MQEVKTGRIEILFSKPVNYLEYKFFESIGNKLVPFVINFIVMFLGMTFVLGIPENIQSLFFLFSFITTLFLCIMLSFLIYAILGIFSFWIEDITSLGWIIDKFIMILGGSFLPVAFFPPFMKMLAIYSPFGASMFITHAVYSDWPEQFFKLVSIQIFWTVILFLFLIILYKKAKLNVSVNGG